LLDESLSHFVSDALEMVGYPITSCAKQGLLGWPDQELIPWMAERGYVWVTKDDVARTEHREEILRERISILWLRGRERLNRTTGQNDISRKQQHRMLTDELGDISDIVAHARGPRYFLVYLRNNGPAMKRYTTLEGFGR
jgi:hypothetical protein